MVPAKGKMPESDLGVWVRMMKAPGRTVLVNLDVTLMRFRITSLGVSLRIFPEPFKNEDSS